MDLDLFLIVVLSLINGCEDGEIQDSLVFWIKFK